MTSMWNAKDYAKQSSAQFKWANEVIERMSLTGEESILDLGCGDGKITALLSQQSSKIIGIDLSENMIKEAASQFQTQTYPNLAFLQMGASELDFDNEFDLIFSNSVLHWVKDHAPVLKGVYNSLKQGGKLFFSFGGKGNISEFEPFIETMIHDQKWTRHFKLFEPEWCFPSDQEYEQWVIESGLTPTRIALVPKDMAHDNRAGLEGWVRTTWHPYTNCLPDSLKNDFVTELVDRFLEKHPTDSEGRTHVRMVRLEVEALKNKI